MVEKGTLKFPVNKLNEYCNSVYPGYTIAIMGSPSSGKTSLALNIAFLNSVLNSKNTLYLYLEDMPERYQYNIFSRYSYNIGNKIETNLLKRGISFSDKETLEKLKIMQEMFLKNKKGEIYYIGMSQLSSEPAIFAKKLAKIVKELKIDILITDYIQKVKTFKPQSWYNGMDYQNQIASSLSLIALGQYGNQPCINIMLSQLNREGQKKASKNTGNISMFDGAEISAIERDSMLIIGVYSDQELRDRGEICIKILKNRDYMADYSPNFTHFDPRYCMVGDLEGNDSVINQDEINKMWEDEYRNL